MQAGAHLGGGSGAGHDGQPVPEEAILGRGHQLQQHLLACRRALGRARCAERQGTAGAPQLLRLRGIHRQQSHNWAGLRAGLAGSCMAGVADPRQGHVPAGGAAHHAKLLPLTHLHACVTLASTSTWCSRSLARLGRHRCAPQLHQQAQLLGSGGLLQIKWSVSSRWGGCRGLRTTRSSTTHIPIPILPQPADADAAVVLPAGWDS